MEKDPVQEVLERMKAIGTGIEGLSKEMEGFKTGQSDIANRVKGLEQRVYDKAYTLPGSNDGKDKGRFSFAKACFAIVSNSWDEAQFELEVFKETRKRTMSTGTGSAGYLIPAEQMTEIIELFRAESVLIRSGVRVLDGLTGSPVTWPKQLTASTSYWVGENAAITPSDLTVGQLSLSPKKIATLVKMSSDINILSNPSAEALVRSDIAISLALGIDLAGLRGSGSANQPLGVAQTPSIATAPIGSDGGILDWIQTSVMEGKLDDANALRGSLGFVFHPKVKRLLKRQRVAQYSGDTGGQFIVLPTISDAMLRDLLGYNFQTTTQIPVNLTKGGSNDCSEVYFANWAELLLGMWGGMEILASNVAGDNTGGAFSSDQLWIRAIQRVDFGVRHAASFCLCADARVTNA